MLSGSGDWRSRHLPSEISRRAQATPLRARAAFSGLLPGRLLKFFLEAALNIIHLERPLLIAAQYLVSIVLE